MADSKFVAVISAARTLALSTPGGEESSTVDEDLAILDKSVQTLSFVRGALVPIRSVAHRAVRGLRIRLEEGASDEEVSKAWQSEVASAVHDFLVQPESWNDEPAREFTSSCGRVFGVHEALVPSLLRTFHSRDAQTRFAIIVKLLNSKAFEFLIKEIDEMPDDMDIQIDDPNESLRELIRDVFAGVEG